MRLVDEVNNVLRFANDLLSIEVIDGIIHCPSVVPLYGGEYAFYVRSVKNGSIKVKLTCLDFIKEIVIKVA